KRNYRPLLPDVHFLKFNDRSEFDMIDEHTAAVILEPIQSEAGIRIPDDDFLPALKARCSEVGALLIFDEIQTGFGRTGKLFAHQHWDVTPDIMCVAKAFGGGMPLGAFVADKSIMDSFKTNPVLGHITTFGGHPVSCAAALASLKLILRDELVEQVESKSKLYFELLRHPRFKKVWGKGLFIGIEMESPEEAARVMELGAKDGGFITDLFLFKPNAFRIGAPLIISEEQIRCSVKLILDVVERV
ncbi:MAG TPA: aminotransferase class III-fold pyridoxal phosphate-dependent enzyme, partial [Bacteroidales bacterium]|nr:aminotransferase class III-fold pyridoxal phosphate-dependent enzyme [Bacteroidales bacterium]